MKLKKLLQSQKATKNVQPQQKQGPQHLQTSQPKKQQF